ncbi:MAG: DNA translocase FtsK 4TM domain-containing protein [Rickettsiaceae bacterium]|nr:DNA translocase FtsK 4TM domain-containing protein [Rickettsiaceae bacterium]
MINIIRKILIHSTVKSTILLSIAIILTISLVSYDQHDPSFSLVTNQQPKNLLGYFGSHLSDILYQFIGLSALIIPLCLFSWAVIMYKNDKVRLMLLKIIALCIAIPFIAIALNNLHPARLPISGGGILGLMLSNYTDKLHLTLNTSIALAAIVGTFFLLLSLSIKPTNYYKFSKRFCYVLTKYSGVKWLISILVRKISKVNFGSAYHLQEEFNITSNKSENDITSRASKSYVPKKRDNLKQQTKDYENIIPAIDLLAEDTNKKIKPQSISELEQKAQKLLEVLKDFGVRGKIIDIKQGPVVTLYDFEPAAGTKSSRVIGLADDIARSLSAVSTRISVVPGKNVLGIELPNENRVFFRLRELIETGDFQDPNILLPLILGKDLGGRPFIADLAKMPHLLVAGTTGSGKSVAINAMIMSILFRYRADECKLIMIDPKMLELSAYDNIPHLMTPVVTEPSKAIVALKWAVKEMENRYRLMSNLGVRNIANYNSKIMEAKSMGKTLERTVQTGFDPETGRPVYESVAVEMNKMPFIVIIVDEMADLMLVAGKDIESSIQRLAQMARAAGIHIIMATQRPSVDVITGVIKANFPSRISFKVTSKIDSRTILGEQGAEQLLGMGDMLYMGNSSKITRIHGPFVDDKEVQEVANFLRSTATPEYISAVTENIDDDIDDPIADLSEDDEIYNQAVAIVKKERKSSISYIQRSLRIGYNRAANIVEKMEKNHILSTPNNSGKREILLPED